MGSESEQDNIDSIMSFALHPACATDTVINYVTSEGMKLYNAAVAKMPYCEFDGNPANMGLFLQVLRQRVDAFGWDDLITIPDATNVNQNLISEYGMISMLQVQAKAATT